MHPSSPFAEDKTGEPADFLFLNKTEAGMKKLEGIVAKQFALENKLNAAKTQEEEYEIAKLLTDIDIKFHSALFEMTGNKSLMDFQSILRHLFTLYVPKLHKDYHDTTLISHISLYNILRTGNADAFRTAMRLHLKTQFDNIDNNLDKAFEQ